MRRFRGVAPLARAQVICGTSSRCERLEPWARDGEGRNRTLGLMESRIWWVQVGHLGVCFQGSQDVEKIADSKSLPNLQTTPGMSTSLALESAHWSFFGWPLCWKLYNLKQQCNNHHWPPNDSQIPAASGFYVFIRVSPATKQHNILNFIIMYLD